MTAAPSYTAADYRTAFQATMPRGAAWSREPDGVQTAVVTALSQSMARLDGDANQLLIDLFPATTSASPGRSGRRASACRTSPSVRRPRRPSASAPSWPGWRVRRASPGRRCGFFANALGYDVTLTVVAPFRVGQSYVGQPLADLQWANTVILKTTPSASPPFADALTAWDLAFCQAGLTRMAPAHLTVIFQS